MKNVSCLLTNIVIAEFGLRKINLMVTVNSALQLSEFPTISAFTFIRISSRYLIRCKWIQIIFHQFRLLLSLLLVPYYFFVHTRLHVIYVTNIFVLLILVYVFNFSPLNPLLVSFFYVCTVFTFLLFATVERIFPFFTLASALSGAWVVLNCNVSKCFESSTQYLLTKFPIIGLN